MKILILSRDSRYTGGVVNYINLLIRNLSARVWFERFIIGKKDDKVNSFSQIFVTIIDCGKLLYKCFRNNYNLVHLNPSLTVRSLLRDGLFLSSLRLAKVENILIFFHGWDESLAVFIKNHYLIKLLFRKVYSDVSVILVLAPQFREFLINIGFEAEKIQVTTTMFDGEIFSSDAEPKDSSGIVILFLSRLVKEKGVHETLKAFELLTARFADAQLFVGGDGPEKLRMEGWVSEHDLNHKVTFTGYVRGKKKGQLLLNSDVFVFPTYHGEGCPIVLLEAMAAGLAVVATPVGAIPEIIENNVNGIILPDITPEGISKALYRFLMDKEFCKKAQLNNRLKAWAHYEASMVAAKIEELYREVAREG